MILHGVQPEELDKIFPCATTQLLRIPRLHERYGLLDVYNEIKSGNWQLWLAIDKEIEGVCLTSIVQYPKTREFSLLGLAGRRMKEWRHFIDVIEGHAKASGCESVYVVGARKGLSKVFPDYDGNRIVLEKKLK